MRKILIILEDHSSNGTIELLKRHRQLLLQKTCIVCAEMGSVSHPTLIFRQIKQAELISSRKCIQDLKPSTDADLKLTRLNGINIYTLFIETNAEVYAIDTFSSRDAYEGILQLDNDPNLVNPNTTKLYESILDRLDFFREIVMADNIKKCIETTSTDKDIIVIIGAAHRRLYRHLIASLSSEQLANIAINMLDLTGSPQFERSTLIMYKPEYIAKLASIDKFDIALWLATPKPIDKLKKICLADSQNPYLNDWKIKILSLAALIIELKSACKNPAQNTEQINTTILKKIKRLLNTFRSCKAQDPLIYANENIYNEAPLPLLKKPHLLHRDVLSITHLSKSRSSWAFDTGLSIASTLLLSILAYYAA